MMDEAGRDQARRNPTINENSNVCQDNHGLNPGDAALLPKPPPHPAHTGGMVSVIVNYQ
jgi:hypothetical protein